MNLSPITFEEREDRIAGFLGLIEAAEILPLDVIRGEGNRAMWNFYLRGFERKFIVAADEESAKAAVQDHATAWLRAAAVRPMSAEELDEDRVARLE